MHYRKAKYLLIPVLFLAVLFVLDKIFLLPVVRNRFIQPGGMIYYKQRELQVGTLKRLLKKEKIENKTVVIMGDSRSLSLGELTLLGSKKMQNKYGDFNIFNFSSPQALPAYYAYLTEKIFHGISRPKYLIIGISPDSLNRNAGIMLKPVMSYGLSPGFIKKYHSMIAKSDREGYENSKRFALAGLGFSIKTLRNRLNGGFGKSNNKALLNKMLHLRRFYQTGKGLESNPVHLLMFYNELGTALQPNMSHYNIGTSPWRYALDMTRGAYYGWVEVAADKALLEETNKLESIYFKNFIVSQEQLYFVRIMLEHARLSGARVLVYWPRVNSHLRKLYLKYPQVSYIWSQIARLARDTGAASMNLNKKGVMKCDSFYDASHISALCAFELQEILLDRVMSIK